MSDKLPIVMRCAWLYYEDGLTQAEIAEELAVSRATVGRLLGDARRTGVVTFQFHSEQLQAMTLGRELREAFGLSGSVVLPELNRTLTQEATNDRLAAGAAQYLADHIRHGLPLALGWGDTVSRTLGAMKLSLEGELRLVTLTGGANVYLDAILGSPEAERPAPVRVQADMVPAPLLASSAGLAAAFSSEADVQRVLRASNEAPRALVGVGSPTADSTLVKLGYVTPAELAEIAAMGAVGDLLGQFFDARGEVLDIDVHRRRIGIDISSLRRRAGVVGVAGGPTKAEAIMAALAGQLIDVLVTDESTARTMLELRADRA